MIFDRFVPQGEGQPTLKKEGLDAVRQASERGRVDERLLAAWNTRWEATVRSAKAEPFALKTDWRFIAGLGRKGPLEVGFTFHRYGFPILPGSSVKGIARAWSLISLAATRSCSQIVDSVKLDWRPELITSHKESYDSVLHEDRLGETKSFAG